MDGVTEDPLRETRKQATERRIAALEAHIEDLEERFRPVGQYIGETARQAVAPLSSALSHGTTYVGICRCDKSPQVHMHLPKTDQFGYPVGAVWDA